MPGVHPDLVMNSYSGQAILSAPKRRRRYLHSNQERLAVAITFKTIMAM